ncbi:MAG: hypothetical protein QM703_25755 [Gemmatales bacterium]
MRRLAMTLLILPALIGCGPNKKVESGKEPIAKVETVPGGSQKIAPTGLGKTK